MILTRIEIENFKQYRGEHAIDIPSQATIGVIGENGTGKTTLFEAIEWCLYSPRSISPADVRPRGTGGTTTVTVYLESGDGSRRFAVQRILKKAPTAAVFRIDADGEAEKVAEGARQVSDYVASRLIGLSHTAFTATFFTRQQELHLFGDETPAKRREEIGRMLGLETIRAAQRDIVGERGTATAEAKALANQYQRESMGRDTKAERAVAEGTITAAEKRHRQALRASADATVARGDCESRLAAAQARREQDQTLVHQLDRLQQEITAFDQRRSRLDQELLRLAGLESERGKCAPLAAQADALQAELAKQEDVRQRYQVRQQTERMLQEAQRRQRDTCQQMRSLVREVSLHPHVDGWEWTSDDDGQPVMAIDRLGSIAGDARPDDLDRVEQSLRAARQLAVNLDTERARLAKFAQRRDELAEDERRRLANGDPRTMLERLDAQRDQLRASQTRAETACSTTETSRDKTRKLVLNIEQQQFDDDCPTCGRPFSDADASIVIQSLRDRIAAMSAEIDESQRAVVAIKTRITSLMIERAGILKQIDELDLLRQRLEKSVGVIDAQQESVSRIEADLGLAISRSGLTDAPTEREIEQAAAATRQARLLAGTLGSLRTARNELLRLDKEISGASRDLQDMGEIQFDAEAFARLGTQATKADRASTSLRHIDEQLGQRPALLEEQAQIVQQRAEAQTREQSLSRQRNDLGYMANESTATATALEQAQLAERRAVEESHRSETAVQQAKHQLDLVVRDEKRLKYLASTADRRQAEADTLDLMAKELTEFERYAAARKLPVLADITSQLVSAITDGKYDRVDFDQDLGIVASDGSIGADTYGIGTFSGGERDAITLAARIALSHMVGRQAAHPPGFLVLDEVFGSLDTDRRSRLMDMLGTMTATFPELQQVFIISHVDDVRTSPVLDDLWRIEEAEDGGSRVSVLAAGAEIDTL